MKNNLYYLLLLAKAEHQEAMSDLIQRFEPKIKKLSSTFPSEDRDDIEQELRIQVLHAVKKFNIEEENQK
ncbi:helix-turn-helix domain-containing protein [Halobacillus sp. Marseille-Q1614]|uniref:helix-turn-helix domain-containing protein n=1 Tax=Halobacillus sp. Marseille-Q1614 TaxID=2709134 RepID=UPI00157037C8|nr:helix-turn-helix domain-containing protein [Halobacillus sp. Marseille-Q1614]